MKKDNAFYLRHMLDATEFILFHMEGISFEEFCDDGLLHSAVVHQLQIIGQAARSLSKDFIHQHAEVPWGEIIGMRNHIVHEYFRVDFDFVWDTVQHDLPDLQARVRHILFQTDRDTHPSG
jgi:uncharacterized protein with HEPN domain